MTQPRTQSTFSATATYSVFAPVRWAQKNQAADQVGIARISAEETRRQVALMAAQAYLRVIAAQRQQDIAVRNRDTAKALDDYARPGSMRGRAAGSTTSGRCRSWLRPKGSIQADELARAAGPGSLGVALFVEGPVDANGDPV